MNLNWIMEVSAFIFSALLMFAVAWKEKKLTIILIFLSLVLMFLLRTVTDTLVLHLPLMFVLQGANWEIWIAYGGILGIVTGYFARKVIRSGIRESDSE